jgi:hypothetical protein
MLDMKEQGPGPPALPGSAWPSVGSVLPRRAGDSEMLRGLSCGGVYRKAPKFVRTLRRCQRRFLGMLGRSCGWWSAQRRRKERAQSSSVAVNAGQGPMRHGGAHRRSSLGRAASGQPLTRRNVTDDGPRAPPTPATHSAWRRCPGFCRAWAQQPRHGGNGRQPRPSRIPPRIILRPSCLPEQGYPPGRAGD